MKSYIDETTKRKLIYLVHQNIKKDTTQPVAIAKTIKTNHQNQSQHKNFNVEPHTITKTIKTNHQNQNQ